MDNANIVAFKLSGRRALFSDPVNRIGGEKFSYQIPTYQALKGAMESVYWKPTITWRILRLKVLNPIQTESVGIKPIVMSGGNDLSYYTYLKDVAYEVEAKFIWNNNREDLKDDRNENKHYSQALRHIERGGRRDIFLGTRECQAYVEPVEFGGNPSSYANIQSLSLGICFHSFVYPDEAIREEEKGCLTALFWRPELKNGIVEFIQPNDCTIRKEVRKMNMKKFTKGVNFSLVEEV